MPNKKNKLNWKRLGKKSNLNAIFMTNMGGSSSDGGGGVGGSRKEMLIKFWLFKNNIKTAAAVSRWRRHVVTLQLVKLPQKYSG